MIYARRGAWVLLGDDSMTTNDKGKAPHRNGFAYGFYISEAWRDCRAAFLASRRGLCERCLARGEVEPATQVHHKIRLTPKNINDPSVALNFENLEALCEKCHHAEHGAGRRRWRTDEDGHVLL